MVVPPEKCHDRSIHYYVPSVRYRKVRAYEDRRVPDCLRMHGLRYEIAAEARRLLRLLLLWFDTVPAGPGGAQWGSRRASFRMGNSACNGVARISKKENAKKNIAKKKIVRGGALFAAFPCRQAGTDSPP